LNAELFDLKKAFGILKEYQKKPDNVDFENDREKNLCMSLLQKRIVMVNFPLRIQI